MGSESQSEKVMGIKDKSKDIFKYHELESG